MAEADAAEAAAEELTKNSAGITDGISSYEEAVKKAEISMTQAESSVSKN